MICTPTQFGSCFGNNYGKQKYNGPSAVRIDSVSPGVVDIRGGRVVTLIGTFPTQTPHLVYVGRTGTAADIPCFGTVSNNAFNAFSEDGTTLEFAAPQVEDPGGYFVFVTSTTGSAVSGLLMVESHFPEIYYSTRLNYPSWYGVGPRRLELEAFQ